MSRIRRAAALALLLSVAPLAGEAGPSAPSDDDVKIFGIVTAGDDELPWAGARVDALEDGVFLRGTAWTDESGRYELAVPNGRLYDLRVVAGAKPWVASFARDLDLRGRKPVLRDFRLRELRPLIEECGIAFEDLADTDFDAVPDVFEEPVRIDWEVADTGEDGVFDGIAAWVGADPLRGPERTEAVPETIWPAPGVEVAHPMVRNGATPPLELIFQHVFGATGYRMRVRSVAGRTEFTWDLYFHDGEILLGEGVAVRWVPPSGWDAGVYEMEVQGFYEAPDRPVGGLARTRIVLFEAEKLEPLEIEGEITLSGLQLASTVRLWEGALVTVPEGETLHLVAMGDVSIDRGARIVGEAGAPGASVVISAAGSVQVMGPISAGRGAPGEAEQRTSSGRKDAAVARGKPGGNGGSVMIVSLATVVIGREARIASGNGGIGGEAVAKAGPGGDALAIGGDGGRGGRLLVHASNLVVADRPDHLHSGGGGAGGDGRARGGNGEEDLQAGLSSALPGVGGDAGDIWLCDWNLRRDGFVALCDDSFPVGGGVAGSAGRALPEYGSKGSFDGSRSRQGRPHEVHCGVPGGGGWAHAGDGQAAIARGGEGLGAGDGGFADARGGPGGVVRRIGISSTAFQWIFGYLPTAGEGGRAEATGGLPATSGDGGSARAEGGAGGAGLFMPISIFSTGGAGGDAVARGLSGVRGSDRCPGSGRRGSDGGSAEATGGAGGFGNYFGGPGGDALAEGGNGGDGGMGHGGGRGGSLGPSNPRGGARGEAWLYRGPRGAKGGAPGQRGKRGPTCPYWP